MHPTKAFRKNDREWQDAMIRRIAFATVVGETAHGIGIAHTPIVLDDAQKLRFHLARSNSLARSLDGSRAVAVLNGPDAYISARWYDAADQVPTWNYIALECEGEVRRLPDADLPAFLETLSAIHEARIETGAAWTMDKMSRPALDALLRGIVGFEMSIHEIRETVKLSQNKPAAERGRLIAGLEAEGEHEMAGLMRECRG